MGIDAGSRVLHYVLVRRLGAGGMGEVFLADDTRLDRRVAIKFLIGEADDHARKRILQEARSAAALDHPNICAIYEVGSDPTVGDFIVMQYVEGETLAAMLKRGPLVPARAMEIVERVASALVAAHARGIVHRDLKPQNVIVTAAGDVKLLDFGVAKRLADGQANAEARTSSALTYPGAVVGTPAYMSPEQIRSEPADVRSDLFALGCVLYECLTGRRAFWGATSQDVFAQILQAHPAPPSEFSGAVTPAHDAICARLMQKSPGDRFQTASEALGAIREITGGTATKTRAPEPTPRKWPIEAIVGVIGVIAFAVYFLWPRVGLPVPPAEAANLYNEGVDAIRDGRYVAARSLLHDAVKVFPEFFQAHLRLAEVHSELDADSQAKDALLRVDELVPDINRLPEEERVRVAAIRAFVTRNFKVAVKNYTKLAELRPEDAGRWLDVGRVEEASGSRSRAKSQYEKAASLDKNYAAAQLRYGDLRAQLKELDAGLVNLDEASRLYRNRGQVEGEVEVLLRRGSLLTPVRFTEARGILEKVRSLTQDPRFIHQRVRAEFALGRLTAVSGRFAEAEKIGQDAVQQAMDAGLWGNAASGQIDLAITLMSAHDEARAKAILDRAIALAAGNGAVKTELRGRIQQAFFRANENQAEEAIKLIRKQEPLLQNHQFPRFEIDARNILARAYEQLEDYVAAQQAADEALALAESVSDKQQMAMALDAVAGVHTAQGRLPDALVALKRRVDISVSIGDRAGLAYDLPNLAELLIRLGRGPEAEEVLQTFEERAAEKIQAYVGRLDRIASLRALRAATEGRFTDVIRFASEAERLAAKPEYVELTRILAVYARAKTGQLRDVPARVPASRASPAFAREISYWEAQAWLALGNYQRAIDVAMTAWKAPGATNNTELKWRLAAVASIASQALRDKDDKGAEMPAPAQSDIDALRASWADQSKAYLERRDLVVLRQRLS